MIDLAFYRIGDPGLTEIAQALAGGQAPCSSTLRVMRLWDCGFESRGVQDLARALGEGACRKLEVLQIGASRVGDEGAEKLAVAFRAGAVPKLTTLELMVSRIGEAGAKALAEAVRSGACPQLKEVRASEPVQGLVLEVLAGRKGWGGSNKQMSFEIV